MLYTHPAIREAAAVGVPDDYRGEVIKAYVVLKDGAEAAAEDLMAHCRERLAKHKLPVSIEFLAEIPKTTVGKIDKKALRDG